MSLLKARRYAARVSVLAVACTGVFAAQASAAGPPIVSVPTAPVWQSAGAYKLSATVVANGSSTSANIQYGATTSYGSVSPNYSYNSGDTGSFTHVTTSKPVGSTVHYRVRAINSSGITYGPDQTYVVGGAPIVTAGSSPRAVPVAVNPRFRLYSNVQSNQLFTTTSIQYGPTTSYGTTATGSSLNAGTTADGYGTVINPTPGSTINYRIVATNAAGTTYGPNRVWTVPAGVVRTVYMYPTDRPFRLDYRDLISSAMNTIQAFYSTQVGKTFTPTYMPIGCPLDHDAAYYNAESQNSSGQWIGTWNKLDAALSNCAGVDRIPANDLVVYADVHGSCNDRIGAAVPGLTFMGDTDLQGLNGQTGFPNAPCGSGNDTRTGPWGYTGGAAHEMGHTFGLPHPDDILATCATPAPWTPACQEAYDSLMYIGYLDIRATSLLARDKTALLSSSFFS